METVREEEEDEEEFMKIFNQVRLLPTGYPFLLPKTR